MSLLLRNKFRFNLLKLVEISESNKFQVYNMWEKTFKFICLLMKRELTLD